MTNAKIDIAVGDMKFVGEGTEAWVAEQLEKVLAAATALGKSGTQSGGHERRDAGGTTTDDQGEFKESLASYIRSHNAEENQNRRFLTTADWLRRRGTQQLNTAAVAKALRDNHQKKLANPSECLNRLCAAGQCEKNGEGFFITPDGHKALEQKS